MDESVDAYVHGLDKELIELVSRGTEDRGKAADLIVLVLCWVFGNIPFGNGGWIV